MSAAEPDGAPKNIYTVDPNPTVDVAFEFDECQFTTMMATDRFHAKYPWAFAPFVCNAPMGGGTASAEMAVAVTSAGSLGFIGAGGSRSDLSSHLEKARKSLPPALPRNYNVASGRLPIGVGFLCFGDNLHEILPVLQKYNPVAVWLFAARDNNQYAEWTKEIRQVCSSDIWIQTCSVTDTVTVAQACKPDVIVLQGQDAGGHGLQKNAGLISLIPEAVDALAKEGFKDLPVLATGGISDGRGCAAAFVLGASGAVMGTRFLASEEVSLPHPGYKEAIIKASDGGQATVRSKVFDDLNAKGNIWPVAYDGRAIRNETYRDSANGMSIEENRKLAQEAAQGRATIWAGTGVGLVREVLPARKIIEDTRNETRQLLDGTAKASI